MLCVCVPYKFIKYLVWHIPNLVGKFLFLK